MDGFISKPIQEEDLFQILARFSPLEQAIESTPYKINPTPLIPVDDASIIDYNYLIDSSNGKREFSLEKNFCKIEIENENDFSNDSLDENGTFERNNHNSSIKLTKIH